MAVNYGIIKKAGAWFSYNGEKIGQGRDNVRKYMVENTEFTDNIEKQVREILNVDDKKGIVETKGDAKDNNDIRCR